MQSYHPPSDLWPMEPEHSKRGRGKSILIWAMLIMGLCLALLFLLLVLFAGYTQSSAPYPWNVTIHSGYTRGTTLLGVPVGETKHAQLHITLSNVSEEVLSTSDLQWMLTDTSTHQVFTGTMGGNVPAVLSPDTSADFSLDFQVPINGDDFTLSLSGPAGSDPTTWPVHFQV